MTQHYQQDEHGYYCCAYCRFSTPHLNRIRNHVTGKHNQTVEPLPLRTWSDNYVEAEEPTRLQETAVSKPPAAIKPAEPKPADKGTKGD